ncbi:MAG TPA: hypothetical protein VGF00_00785 [Acidimicrobiia bacterium]
MVRLLRRALRIGLLAGVGAGILKVVRGRKAHDPWADSWVSTGAPGATRPSAAPVPAAPKPPAPVATASADVAVPPPAAPKPPAPKSSAPADVAVPPAATPAPPAPEAPAPQPAAPDATDAAAGQGDGETGGEDAGEPAPKPSANRASKPSRTGPARRSPTGKAEEPPGERVWVTASDGVCPQSHPVKAKLSSKIFHLPGSRNYSRTQADRCYPDEASAQADGLRPALR